jgi:hypothetical protein
MAWSSLAAAVTLAVGSLFHPASEETRPRGEIDVGFASAPAAAVRVPLVATSHPNTEEPTPARTAVTDRSESDDTVAETTIERLPIDLREITGDVLDSYGQPAADAELLAAQDFADRQAALMRAVADALSSDAKTRGNAARQIWIHGADLDTPDVAIASLQALARDRDEDVAALAQAALADLAQVTAPDSSVLATRAAAETLAQGARVSSESPHNAAEADPASGGEQQAAIVLVEPTDVESAAGVYRDPLITAVSARDPLLRQSALEDVSLLNAPQAKNILLRALADTEQRNRLTALSGLWRLAADGHDVDQRIGEALRELANDSDEAVSSAATTALADLQAIGTSHARDSSSEPVNNEQIQ